MSFKHFSNRFGGDAGDVIGACGLLNGLGFDPREFSIEDFEEALPESHGILRWILPGELRDNPDKITGYPDQQLLAVAELLRGKGPFRIELHDPPVGEDGYQLIQALADPQARLCPGAVYVHHQRQARGITWQWPIKIGFLDDWAGAARQIYDQLVRRQGYDNWRESTIRFQEPNLAPHGCGVVIAVDSALAERRLVEQSIDLKCGLVLVLNSPEIMFFAPQFGEVAKACLDRSWAGGVCFTQDPGTAAFIYKLVRKLSHNFTIDEALFSTCRKFDLPTPFLLGSTSLMRDSKLTRELGRIRRRLDSPKVRHQQLRIEESSATQVITGAMPNEFKPKLRGGPTRGDHESAAPDWESRELSRRLQNKEQESRFFDRESDFSVGMAELSEQIDERLEEVETGPRYLQAKVSSKSVESIQHHFLPGELHTAAVRIGLPEAGWLQPTDDIPFPMDSLPIEREEYELTVVFSPLSTGIPESGSQRLDSKMITLPRYRGNSSQAIFEFEVPGDAQHYKARLLVLFENRILQTGVLSGPVGYSEDSGGAITFALEALMSRQFAGLDRGTKFEQALLFNNNEDGAVGLTVAAGGEVRFGLPKGISQQMDRWIQKISVVAHQHNDFSSTLDQNEDLVRLLVAFARSGSDLLDIIKQSIPETGSFDSRKPIQVISKTMGAKIPIEFFYDHESPERTAELCPGALQALKNKNCRCDKEHNRAVFCPSGFWGMNRIIERHAFSPDEEGHGFVLQNEPTPERQVLPITNYALLAGTTRVDKSLDKAKGLNKVANQLSVLTGNRFKKVESWREWQTQVSTQAPNLMVLLVHTENADAPFDDEQQMEIGDGNFLAYNDIREDVVSSSADPGPLVVLLGCKTGTSKIDYKTLAEKFRRSGAAVVVSSDATIHSAHAVPLLERMIEKLHEGVQRVEPSCLGEVMRDIRREMVAEGIPIILCVTAYGDADWIFN